MIRAATMPTAANVPPTAPLLSKKLDEPEPLEPLSSPFCGRDVEVRVTADPPGAVAWTTEVTTTGVSAPLLLLLLLLVCGAAVLVGVVVAVDVTGAAVDVCAARGVGGARGASARTRGQYTSSLPAQGYQ